MVFSEWWAFEIISLLIAYFGNTQLAAHSIIMSISSLFYMIPLGLSVSASNRMGNQLALLFATVNSSVLTAFKYFWSYLFAENELVANFVSKLLPIVALFEFFDGISSVSGGLLRGQDKQSKGAMVSLTSYYGLALPFG